MSSPHCTRRSAVCGSLCELFNRSQWGGTAVCEVFLVEEGNTNSSTTCFIATVLFIREVGRRARNFSYANIDKRKRHELLFFAATHVPQIHNRGRRQIDGQEAYPRGWRKNLHCWNSDAGEGAFPWIQLDFVDLPWAALEASRKNTRRKHQI